MSPAVRRIYGYCFLAVALLNFALILFDYFYLEELPFGNKTIRDISGHYASKISVFYDSVKGIKPHRFTVEYMEEYHLFKNAVLANNGTDAKKHALTLFEKSEYMIDSPYGSGPFSSGKGDGQLEVIKNNIKNFTGADSAHDGFRVFFLSEDIMQKEVHEKRFAFFEKYMMPVLQRNYSRSIDGHGRYYDHFYLIDRWFVYFFIADFLFRWCFSAVFVSKKWYLFPLRRWYEIFNLFYPHYALWPRLMRSLPLYIRIRESGILSDSEGLIPEIIHENADIIAREISSRVLANIFLQTSATIKTLSAEDVKKIIQGEGGEKLKIMFTDISRVVIRDVLPAMSDDFALYLRNIIREILDPWLTTSIAPLVRAVLLNLEITIQDTVDSALYSEKGREENIRLMEEFINIFLKRISEEQNFTSVRENLASFMEMAGRELAAGKRID